jgi:hypothetical protein
MSRGPAALGACCRTTCRLGGRFTVGSPPGATMGGLNGPRARDGRSRTGRARGQPLGRDHRQPERQDHRGRRPARLRRRQKGQRAQAPRWSTRTGVASCSNRIRRASRIATVADRFCESRGASFHSFAGLRRRRDAGEKVAKATVIAVEIVRKNPDQVGFAVNPRRWVVERFFRVDRAQSTAGKGLRGHHRLRLRLPLRRICHAARTSDRSCFMTFETDS